MHLKLEEAARGLTSKGLNRVGGGGGCKGGGGCRLEQKKMDYTAQMKLEIAAWVLRIKGMNQVAGVGWRGGLEGGSVTGQGAHGGEV
jgi:hypothetical protein